MDPAEKLPALVVVYHKLIIHIQQYQAQKAAEQGELTDFTSFCKHLSFYLDQWTTSAGTVPGYTAPTEINLNAISMKSSPNEREQPDTNKLCINWCVQLV